MLQHSKVESNLPNDFGGRNNFHNPSPNILNPKRPIAVEREDNKFAQDQAVDDNELDWKRKELLKRNLIDVEKKQRSNAIDGHSRQKIGAWNVPNVGKDDPLIQLQYKKEDMDFKAKQRLVHDENLSQKSRDRIKDMLAAESNQRRLLNEANRLEDKRGKFHDSNKELMRKLNGPGMKLMREKFGIVLDEQSKPQKGWTEKVPVVPKINIAFSRIAALGDFDMEAYLSAQRMKEGEGDPMRNFQFNQVVSDSTPPDRYLKDFRHPR